MQYSGKMPRPIGKNKGPNNNQISPPYNGGLRFLSAPNSGQLQVNRKFVNNIGNMNEVSVLQYHRSSNMQFKNNNLEMNHYQSFRHHQQAFYYENPPYNNHLNQIMAPKMPFNNHHTQRKFFKEQIKPPLVAIPPAPQQQTHLENRGRKFREMPPNSQEANKIKNSQSRFNKLPTKSIAQNNERNPIENKNNAKAQEIVEDKRNESPEVLHNGEQVINENGVTSEKDLSEGTGNKEKLAREKTPMCLINDLARFNKISFQYRLTSESGPAHSKRFTVTLMLGEEEYTAEGTKIKEAQHLAAKYAIEKTKYNHPIAKNNNFEDESTKPNLTPTVELNALAMKLGQQTCYILDDQNIENTANDSSISPQEKTSKTLAIQQQQQITEAAEVNVRQNPTVLQRRQQFPRYNRFQPFQHLPPSYYSTLCPTKITLIVGTKQFVGVGKTLQLAKHDAASKALKLLKEQMAKEQRDVNTEEIDENESKSPISLVFEIGAKRNLTVDFKVLREEGPAHMRTFVTACIAGDIVTEGEGTGKKASKKKAAQKMLEKLKTLPPLSPVNTIPKRTKVNVTSKKSNCRDIGTDERRENKERASSSYRNKKYSIEGKKPFTLAEGDNPINKLIEWHQNRKEKEPEFKVINEFGKENARRKQFVVEVSSNNIVVRGFGINKRLAKQDAARKFLDAVRNSSQPIGGINVTQNVAMKSNIANKDKPEVYRSIEECNAGVKTDMNQNTITIEAENKQSLVKEKETIKETSNNSEIQNLCEKENVNSPMIEIKENSLSPETNKTIATTSIPIASATVKESPSSSAKSPALYMKDQLMYLAKLLGFEVEFSDYPKGNHDEFLTIVMLSTTPPQICHGVGVTSNESQEDAAKNALKILSKMGLNNVVKS